MALARSWQEFKDSLRGEQESGGNWTIWWAGSRSSQVLWRRRQVCAGVQCAAPVCPVHAGVQCAPVCSVLSAPGSTTNQPPVLSQPLPCQGLSRAQRESVRVRRRRSGSVLKFHGNRSGFRRSQKWIYQPLERVCSSSMEREREIPDVFDVFAIGKSPLPLAKYWKYVKSLVDSFLVIRQVAMGKTCHR